MKPRHFYSIEIVRSGWPMKGRVVAQYDLVADQLIVINYPRFAISSSYDFAGLRPATPTEVRTARINALAKKIIGKFRTQFEANPRFFGPMVHIWWPKTLPLGEP
jgi:hypothetical protein